MENGKSTIIITRNHSEKSVVKVKHQLVVTFEKLKSLGKHQHQHTTRKCELRLLEKLEMLCILTKKNFQINVLKLCLEVRIKESIC